MRFASAPLSSRDLVAHLIPGAILLALAVWFLDGFVGLLINLMTLGTGVVSLVIWLLGAYVAGVFVQLFGGLITGRKPDALEGLLALQLLAEGDDRLSANFKRELAARAQKMFGFVPAGKELYWLCTDYVMQHDAARRAESLSAFGEMYRGLLVTARVGMTISVLIFLKHAVLLLLPQMNIIVPVTGFLDYETVHLVIGVLLFVVFGVGVGLLKARIVFCAESVVSEVYTSFVALSVRNGTNDR